MTLFTFSPDLVRGLACAVWLAVLLALLIRRPVWRFAPGGVRLMLAGLAIIGAGLLMGAAFTALHRVAVSPDRIAAEAISLIAGLFALAGVLRFRPVAHPPPVAGARERELEDAPLRDEPAPASADAHLAMTRLAGGLAHDFSNVLTVILSASEILLMEQDVPEKVRRRLERMHGAAQRGAALTDKLRAFAGRQDLQSEAIDLHELLRSAAVELKAVLGPDIELHYELAEGPSPVLLDAEQMRAAIGTVLAYTRSTMPESGRVTLSTRFDAMPEASRPPVRAVVLTMARSGTRMEMDYARRLLAEPYSHGGATVTGGGFGLSLVEGFIRQSGGIARFIEEPEQAGAVLELWLPLAQPAAPSEAL